MRRKLIASLVGFLVIGSVSVLNAAMFQTVSTSKAKLVQQGNNRKYCIVCTVVSDFNGAVEAAKQEN